MAFPHIAFQLENIHHHHSLEETFCFPAMEEKTRQRSSQREHQRARRVRSEAGGMVQEDERVYDGNVFLGTVEPFEDTALNHMTLVRFILYSFIAVIH